MKLLRYGSPGQEKPGCLDKQGHIRDLSSHVEDITPAVLAPDALHQLKQLDIESLPKVPGPVRFGAPWTGGTLFLGVGLNYRDHANEVGADIPVEPILFTKWCQPTGANDDIIMPPDSTQTDWEVELGVVIGRTARHVRLEDALDHVAGYCVINDVSERSYQFDRGGTWDKGKGYEGFGPAGPLLVTTDEIADVQNLNLWLDVNGERKQTSNTSNMIFDVAHLIHYISQFTTLSPGDVIATGTPAGVGVGFKPPVFLKNGDTITLSIEGLGEQSQRVLQAAP